MKLEPFACEEGDIQDVREHNASTYLSAHKRKVMLKEIGLVEEVTRMSREMHATFQSEGMRRRAHVKI
jgi:hypothetical protein